MKKFKCSVCGYVHTGEEAPHICPVCGAKQEAFSEVSSDTQTSDLAGYLSANIKGETWEVTHYMAMALKAQTLGLSEVAESLYRIAMEEAYHGANFIQRGSKDGDFAGKIDSSDHLSNELKEDIEQMLAGEHQAHKGKNEAASLALAEGKSELAGFFRIAAEDEARHANILEGILKRYFDK